jgi:alpha/beta hydrolase fold
MFWNGFHFYRTSISQFLTLFPFRPLALLSRNKSPAKHLTYWYREHLSDTHLPILFIHGIGVGLYPYANFLRDINAAGGDDATVGIIAIEIMTVSSRITRQALDKDVLVDEVRAILEQHGWTKYVLVGHSYGTVICTHLLRSEVTSPAIGPVLLIDPICFLLHLPDVAFNFTHREPIHVKEFVLWYFGSKDIGVAHTLARRFFWHENILWKEDLYARGLENQNVTVVLSGKDDIVNAAAVRQYLTDSSGSVQDELIKETDDKEGKATIDAACEEVSSTEITYWSRSNLEVIWFERFHHGEAFNTKKARTIVIKAIRGFSSQEK